MKTRRQRTCKARSSCSSRNGYEVSTQGSDASSTMSASTTLGSKRRAPYDHSDSEASLESQKQQRLVVSPSQQQCEHPRPDLSRTDSVTLLEGSVASADSQLLCTEAFAAEDDTSSFPHDQAGASIDRPDAQAASSGHSSQSVTLPVKDFAGAIFDVPGPQQMIIELTSLYGFSAYAVQLGTSYFARICQVDHGLLISALQHPLLAPLLCNSNRPRDMSSQPATRAGAGLRAICPAHKWVMAILLVCIFIAAKNVESLRYRRLLPSMLTHALHLQVDPTMATCVEMECLQALEWRLGPHFHEATSI